MTRARVPRPHEVAAARRDPRLLRAAIERQADTAWRTRGVCQTVDPETFFPAPTDPPDAAVALCGTCSVQGPCLAWALEAGDCHGVWGGTTARERRAMVVAWRTPEQPEERPYADAEDSAALVVGGSIPAPGWSAAEPAEPTIAVRGKRGTSTRRRPPSTDRPSAAVGIVQHSECGPPCAERTPVVIPLGRRPLDDLVTSAL
jgi:WhiB family redox-sensing transcriptional regulator